MDLEKDNLAIKEKGNLLSRELTKMNTKIKRLEELMKSGRSFSDKGYGVL
jgi:hypothetical protein